jgi:hypothetical protein
MTSGLALIVRPALGTAVSAASPGLLWPDASGSGPAARPRSYAITASRSTNVA